VQENNDTQFHPFYLQFEIFWMLSDQQLESQIELQVQQCGMGLVIDIVMPRQ
jgi:hypothetical protein